MSDPVQKVTATVITVVAKAQSTISKIGKILGKLLAFGEKHWKLVCAVLICLVLAGGIYAVISHFTISNLNSDVQRLSGTNNAILGYAHDLAVQIETSQQLTDRLASENGRLKESLSASQSDNVRLRKSIKDSTGFANDIGTNDSTANGLIESVERDIEKALGQN